MPIYQLTAADDDWLETVGRFRSREACYRTAIEWGEGEYVILLADERDRELRVSPDGTLTYRIPGASNWHTWKPAP